MAAQTTHSALRQRSELIARTAVLKQAGQSAVEYLREPGSRSVAPGPESIAALIALCGPLPEAGTIPPKWFAC